MSAEFDICIGEELFVHLAAPGTSGPAGGTKTVAVPSGDGVSRGYVTTSDYGHPIKVSATSGASDKAWHCACGNRARFGWHGEHACQSTGGAAQPPKGSERPAIVDGEKE